MSTPTKATPRFKKLLKVAAGFGIVAFVVGAVGYLMPGPAQLVLLLIAYFSLYIGIITAGYVGWHKYLSPAALKAEAEASAAASKARTAGKGKSAGA